MGSELLQCIETPALAGLGLMRVRVQEKVMRLSVKLCLACRSDV